MVSTSVKEPRAGKKAELEQQIDHYAGLPYMINIEPGNDGDRYVARLVELPECSMAGDTPEAAVGNLEENKREWIEDWLKQGNKMPSPLRMRNLSGKFQVRISPSLHEAIALRAELDGISLNSYVSSALSRVVGQEESLEILIKESPNAGEGPWLRIRTRK